MCVQWRSRKNVHEIQVLCHESSEHPGPRSDATLSSVISSGLHFEPLLDTLPVLKGGGARFSLPVGAALRLRGDQGPAPGHRLLQRRVGALQPQLHSTR